MKDYFWINDMHPRMVIHPYRTDLNGKDLSDYQDPNGKRVFVEFVNIKTNAMKVRTITAMNTYRFFFINRTF